MGSVLGNGVFNSDGDMWRFHRSMTRPFFAKDKKSSRTSAEEEFFANGKPKEKEPLPEAKSSEQKTVDAAVLAGIKKTANLEKYLKASWGLSKGQFAHQVRTHYSPSFRCAHTLQLVF